LKLAPKSRSPNSTNSHKHKPRLTNLHKE
jgi:hypothetical protein